MKYRFLEDVAIAEAAFEAFGKSEQELLENSAEALFELMADTQKIQPKTKVGIRLYAENLEDLLFNWLSELVFIKDAQNIVFGEFKIILEKQKNFALNAECFGEHVEYPDKRLRNDVKAITKHLYKVEGKKGKFKATVVADI